MQQETDLIVSAIKRLKKEQGLSKDYVFPNANAFFTSMLYRSGGVES
ncbi:hypothetical protein [Aeromonas dhakensis]